MRRSHELDAVLLILLCSGGCGGGNQPGLEDAAVCSAGWRALTPPKPFDVTSPLVYQGGKIYYSSLNSNALLAVPVDGSDPSMLASGASLELWVEGDHLLFPDSRGIEIYSLPLSGGVPQVLIDGAGARPQIGIGLAHTFTADDLYWIEEDNLGQEHNPTTVWHMARPDGLPSLIGTLTFKEPGGLDFPGLAIALSGGSVVIGSDFGQAATVPVDGTGAMLLAPPQRSGQQTALADLAGVDALGAYWVFPGTPELPASLMLSPVDGGAARPFWPAMPATVEPTKIWPNPEGGWLVLGFQKFADGLSHTTITLIDTQGSATRLACSPGDGSQSWIEKGVAVAPDAIYVAATNLSASTWEIDRIAR